MVVSRRHVKCMGCWTPLHESEAIVGYCIRCQGDPRCDVQDSNESLGLSQDLGDIGRSPEPREHDRGSWTDCPAWDRDEEGGR